MLNKPDTNKPVFRMFPELADKVLNNRCLICKQMIDPDSFKDELSRKEYFISGLCADCQREIFG